jgi:PST family polysaccharide transporter
MLRDILSGAVSQLALPLFSRVQSDFARLVGVYTQALRLTFFIACPVFVLLACCAEDVVRLAFGAKWLGIPLYLSISAVLALQFFARLYSGPMFRAVGRAELPNVALGIQIAYLAVGMAVFGKYGAAYAMILWVSRVFVTTPIDVWLLKRATGMRVAQQFAGTLDPLIAATAMAILVIVIGRSQLQGLPLASRLAIEIAIAVTCYLGCMLLLERALTRQLFSFLRQASTLRA